MLASPHKTLALSWQAVSVRANECVAVPISALKREQQIFNGISDQLSDPSDAYADMLLVEGNSLEDLSVMVDLSVIVDYANPFEVIVKGGKIYKNLLSS